MQSPSLLRLQGMDVEMIANDLRSGQRPLINEMRVKAQSRNWGRSCAICYPTGVIGTGSEQEGSW